MNLFFFFVNQNEAKDSQKKNKIILIVGGVIVGSLVSGFGYIYQWQSLKKKL